MPWRPWTHEAIDATAISYQTSGRPPTIADLDVSIRLANVIPHRRRVDCIATRVGLR
jgi:hypothetical protein